MKLIDPKQRNLKMTLEKLLIFGFALAALFAITTVAFNMMTDRGTRTNNMKALSVI